MACYAHIIMFSSHVSKRAWCILVNQEFEWYKEKAYIIQCINDYEITCKLYLIRYTSILGIDLRENKHSWLSLVGLFLFLYLVSLQTVIERASSKYIQCVLVAQMSFYVLLMLTVIMII